MFAFGTNSGFGGPSTRSRKHFSPDVLLPVGTSPLLLHGAAAGIGLLIGLVFVVLHFALIVWTYSDAEKRSSHPPILWALIVFFVPFLGILLYFVIERDSY